MSESRTAEKHTDPQCIHGRAVFERCTACEAEVRRGSSTGFVTSNASLEFAIQAIKDEATKPLHVKIERLTSQVAGLEYNLRGVADALGLSPQDSPADAVMQLQERIAYQLRLIERLKNSIEKLEKDGIEVRRQRNAESRLRQAAERAGTPGFPTETPEEERARRRDRYPPRYTDGDQS